MKKIISSLFVIVIVCFIGIVMFNDMEAPSIALSTDKNIISPNLDITVTAEDSNSSIKKISVRSIHNGITSPLAEQVFQDKNSIQTLPFSIQTTGVRDGDIDIEITTVDNSLAWFGRGNKRTETFSFTIDATPPRVIVKTTPPNVRRGGTAVVAYSVSKEVSKSGVDVNGLFFPGYKQTNGDFVCFFAFPYYMKPSEYNPQLVVEDIAGNSQVTPVAVYKINREFKHDDINISENFINTKVQEFTSMVSGNYSGVELFLQVNGPVRQANAEKLFEIARDTSPDILWKNRFLRMPRTANRAGFADHRTYFWQGQPIDEQTHLGLDLASVVHDNVPSTNNGRVVFTGYLGIYGNLVIVDHGAGIHSLYSHLSEIGIDHGAIVKTGDILGKTGATGMAGGDHLHYGVLVGGLEVTPIEWLDPKWIKDNVTDRLSAAEIPLP